MEQQEIAIKELEDAIFHGDVTCLDRILQNTPNILAYYGAHKQYNPVHIASQYDNSCIVENLLKRKPSLVWDQDDCGLYPIHYAASNGNVDVVRVLLTFGGRDLFRQKDKSGWTALHKAASKSRKEVIDLILVECFECLKDLTLQDQSCLHLSVIYHQHRSFETFLHWLEHLGQKDIINYKDMEGNTVLHLAISSKETKILSALLQHNGIRQVLEVNITNHVGQTAFDMFYTASGEVDSYIEKMLSEAGATTSRTTRQNRIGRIGQTDLIMSNEGNGESTGWRTCYGLSIYPQKTRFFLLTIFVQFLVVTLTNVSSSSDSNSKKLEGPLNIHQVIFGDGTETKMFYMMTGLSTLFVMSIFFMVLLAWTERFRLLMVFVAASISFYYFSSVVYLIDWDVRIGSHSLSGHWLVWLGVIFSTIIMCVCFFLARSFDRKNPSTYSVAIENTISV